MGAMTIVEIVDSHRGFKVVTDAINSKDKRSLMWVVGVITFFMSAILDNLTTTIVMVSLAKKLLPDQEDRKLFGAMIVIAGAIHPQHLSHTISITVTPSHSFSHPLPPPSQPPPPPSGGSQLYLASPQPSSTTFKNILYTSSDCSGGTNTTVAYYDRSTTFAYLCHY